MNGIGKLTYSNGLIYNCTYVDNIKKGMGILWLPNGDLYQGNYKKDKLDGLHSICYKATGVTADAEFK
jgi:antitoxin component YwqK of YwqJK toxin-antitoxin module